LDETQISSEAFTAVNGVELCHQTFGRPADPAMLLIMGLGAHMIQWDDDFCADLAGRGFFVIRFDNRDVGRSTMIDAPIDATLAALTALMAGEPAKPPYLLADMARDAIGLLDHFGKTRAHIVGFSLGGMIAQTIALEAPERVASLTLIGTSTGERDLPRFGPEFDAIFNAPPPRDEAEYVEANVRAWKLMRPAWDDRQEDVRDGVRAERAARRAPLRPDGGLRQHLAALASGGRRARLADVKAPTLVIHGDSDPLLKPACGEDLARSIPNAKLMLLERMGHTLPRALHVSIIDAIAENTRR
jgi:pimeloyl-ACP methyl ester carboxylesterase